LRQTLQRGFYILTAIAYVNVVNPQKKSFTVNDI
jgi:hypothetical protein